MQQPDGKARSKGLLRRWALPLLVALLVVAVALVVLYFGDEHGAASGGKRRSINELPQPFRWFAQRREAALLKEIKALGKAHEEKSFQRLLVLSVDRDETVRNRAINNTLRNYRVAPFKADEQAMRRLLNTLKDRDPEVRISAAYVLAWLGDSRAVEPLIATLKDADAQVRQCAAHALGMLKDPRAVEPLIVALEDANAGVRVYSVRALGVLKDPRAVEPLIVALSDADAYVRKFAAMSLKALTGVDFGADGEKWRAWWEENKGRPALRDGTKSE